ncbi:MAG: hypothetical protein GTN36_02700 [Candidatus Aenigmarchaeota archaeon]|nr:hypothetical protein [Candidatus Aenigmarchaeota archaeon]
MKYSIDIETVCGVKTCKGYNTVHQCPHDHALHHIKNKITKIGIYWRLKDNTEKFKSFDSINDFKLFFNDLPKENMELIGQNFKFDIKTLRAKGLFISKDLWSDDTRCMAIALSDKIPEKWLMFYNIKRNSLNKKLGKQIHRVAGKYSLKTLAPYHLNIEPFWENEDHSDEEYLFLDCKYTYNLESVLKRKLEEENTYEFYKDKLLKWEKMLYEAEYRGIRLDLNKMSELEIKYKNKEIDLLKQLDKELEKYNKLYAKKERQKLYEKYKNMYYNAVNKIKEELKEEKESKLKLKYKKLLRSALQKAPKTISFSSKSQVAWLFEECLGYDITYKKREKGKEIIKKGVGKEVINRLLLENKPYVKLYKEYSKTNKLNTSYFPSYKEKLVDDILYCSFNIGGTKTGRLSSSNPNLQQVPADLKEIFIAREGYKLITKDMSGIEPVLIAYLSEDHNLCNLLINGDNFHNYVTKFLVEYVNCDTSEVKKKFKAERDLCKVVDLSLFYGSGKNRLKTTSILHGFNWSDADCSFKIKLFKEKFMGAFKFKENLDKHLEKGLSVTNIMGRKLKIPDKDDVYMTGFNSLIQGSASDLVLESGARILEEKDLHPLLLVHDELVIEVPDNTQIKENEKKIEEKMTNYTLQSCHGVIPLQVEGNISNHWEK